MYVCIYEYMYIMWCVVNEFVSVVTCMYTNIYMCTCTHTYVYVNMYIYIHRVDLHAHAYIYICIYIYIYGEFHIYKHVCIHIHAYVYIYVYIWRVMNKLVISTARVCVCCEWVDACSYISIYTYV